MLIATAGLVPQQPEIPAQQLRSSVDLVRVNVTVVDGNGQPVPGLGPEDFAVFENGRTLSIAAVIPVFRAAGRAARERQATSPAAATKNLYVVILDDLMLRFDGGALFRTKRVFREFVSQLSAGDDVAVLATSGASRHAVTFTSDKATLLHAIDRLMPMSAQPPRSSESTEPPSGSLEPSELWKTRTSAAVLKHAIQELRNVADARKAVVLISEGLPYELLTRGGIGSEMRRELTEIIETGRAAGVPVFALIRGRSRRRQVTRSRTCDWYRRKPVAG